MDIRSKRSSQYRPNILYTLLMILLLCASQDKLEDIIIPRSLCVSILEMGLDPIEYDVVSCIFKFM